MYDVISAVQGGPEFQHQVFDGTIFALKWLLLSLPGEYKYSLRVKNILAGEGHEICIKEFLGWTIDMEEVTVDLL